MALHAIGKHARRCRGGGAGDGGRSSVELGRHGQKAARNFASGVSRMWRELFTRAFRRSGASKQLAPHHIGFPGAFMNTRKLLISVLVLLALIAVIAAPRRDAAVEENHLLYVA